MTSGRDDISLSFERVVFFSDAVFAIVITLLILPLTAEVELPQGVSVRSHVIGTWPHVQTFVITFLVIGQFWMAHHRVWGRLRRYDRGFLWLNLVCLLTVAFMPFPAALLGAQPPTDDRFAVVFYAASLTTASVSLTAMWIYAVRRRLVDESLDRSQVAGFTLGAVMTSAIFLFSIGAAFLGLLAAIIVWVVIPPVAHVLVRWRYPLSAARVSEDR